MHRFCAKKSLFVQFGAEESVFQSADAFFLMEMYFSEQGIEFLVLLLLKEE